MSTGSSNYFSNMPTRTRTDQWIVKLDHTFDQNKKGFFRWTTDWDAQQSAECFSRHHSGGQQQRTDHPVQSEFCPGLHLRTISPSQMLELRANLTRINLILVPIGGFDQNLQGLGFSPSELEGSPTTAFPYITMELPNRAPPLASRSRRAWGTSYCATTTPPSIPTPNYTKIAKNCAR